MDFYLDLIAPLLIGLACLAVVGIDVYRFWRWPHCFKPEITKSDTAFLDSIGVSSADLE